MSSRMFFFLLCLFPLLTCVKELGSSGKCNCHIECDVQENAHKDFRYANTLLVSLNNRIYFREHGSPVLYYSSGNNVEEPEEPSHLEAASVHFHQVRSPPHTTTITNSFKLDTMPHTVDLGRGKGDLSSINSDS